MIPEVKSGYLLTGYIALKHTELHFKGEDALHGIIDPYQKEQHFFTSSTTLQQSFHHVGLTHISIFRH